VFRLSRKVRRKLNRASSRFFLLFGGTAVALLVALRVGRFPQQVPWNHADHVANLHGSDRQGGDAKRTRPGVEAFSAFNRDAESFTHEVKIVGPVQADLAAQGLSRLVVTVRSRDDDSPVAGVRIAAYSLGERLIRNIKGPKGLPGESPATDEQGHAELLVDAGIALTVSLDYEQMSTDALELGPMDAGSVAECKFRVPTRADVLVHGRLVDADSGAPLSGTVTIGEGRDRNRIVETGLDGNFVVSAGSWGQLLASAEAPAYSTSVFELTQGFSNPEEPLMVQLSRYAIVDVYVKDEVGLPVENAWIQLSTYSTYLLQDGTMPISDTRDHPPDSLLRVGQSRQRRDDRLDAARPMSEANGSSNDATNFGPPLHLSNHENTPARLRPCHHWDWLRCGRIGSRYQTPRLCPNRHRERAR
jgi:hypothetical protein